MNPSRPNIRLYVPDTLAEGAGIALPPGQSHYLANVMRVKPGEDVALFNGRDGEWLALVRAMEKKQVTLEVVRQLRPQQPGPDLWLAFAPIKNKNEMVVEKAVELGVSKILPVFTRYCVVRSINHEKLVAHAIEAAEQCERCDVPPIEEHRDIAALLASWPKNRLLFYGDESGHGMPLKALLQNLSPGKYAVLIGPEGGFSEEEHRLLVTSPMVRPFTMGPRILKADTAAVAALAPIQAWVGDWDEKPRFMA